MRERSEQRTTPSGSLSHAWAGPTVTLELFERDGQGVGLVIRPEPVAVTRVDPMRCEVA
jgi:hypothetical protein